MCLDADAGGTSSSSKEAKVDKNEKNEDEAKMASEEASEVRTKAISSLSSEGEKRNCFVLLDRVVRNEKFTLSLKS
jgi:hypothetical protein